MKEIGNIIRNARIAKGLSTKELSRIIGVKASVISEIEHAYVEITEYMLQKFCQVLNIDKAKIEAIQQKEKELQKKNAFIFSEKLKSIKKSLGLNQAQFAKKIGISQSTVSKIERNIFMPSLLVLKRICKNLELNFDETVELLYPEIKEIPKLARKIQSERISQNMTQMELANLCNISYAAIKNIEKGQHCCPRNLRKISQALNIDFKELISIWEAEKCIKENSDDLCQKIKHARIAKNLTQTELAKKAGVSRYTIILIENHNRQPRLFTLKKICDVLQIDYLEKQYNSTENFSEKLRNARKEKALYQYEIAKEAGISSGFYSHIENGVFNPSKKNLQKICEVLELDFDEMLKILEES